jgi:hypothetical protein
MFEEDQGGVNFRGFEQVLPAGPFLVTEGGGYSYTHVTVLAPPPFSLGYTQRGAFHLGDVTWSNRGRREDILLLTLWTVFSKSRVLCDEIDEGKAVANLITIPLKSTPISMFKHHIKLSGK